MKYRFVQYFDSPTVDIFTDEELIDRAKHKAAQEMAKIAMEAMTATIDPDGAVRITIDI